jgi:hypothetical protein
MAVIPVFHGRIDADGKFELAAAEANLRRQYFQTLAGRNVEIVVRKERLKRSVDQNAYLHAVPFPMLAEHLGYESIEDLKLALMGECFGWKKDKLSGHEVPIKPHTSDMTVEECSHFIEWLLPYAALHFNVSIPYRTKRCTREARPLASRGRLRGRDHHADGHRRVPSAAAGRARTAGSQRSTTGLCQLPAGARVMTACTVLLEPVRWLLRTPTLGHAPMRPRPAGQHGLEMQCSACLKTWTVAIVFPPSEMFLHRAWVAARRGIGNVIAFRKKAA